MAASEPASTPSGDDHALTCKPHGVGSSLLATAATACVSAPRRWQRLADVQQRALWNNSDGLLHRQPTVMTGDALLTKFAEEIAETIAYPIQTPVQPASP
ncbi:hypothetical protein [Caballeronia sordidicola]|uniref:hypothetical protein n=1 Tax=Caballeronia sordidicola TaxID=196367 RepID=UPI00094EE639